MDTIAEASVMHRISIPRLVRTSELFPVDSRLELGVGGAGIVGRRVSLLRGQNVIGRGIMGWN